MSRMTIGSIMYMPVYMHTHTHRHRYIYIYIYIYIIFSIKRCSVFDFFFKRMVTTGFALQHGFIYPALTPKFIWVFISLRVLYYFNLILFFLLTQERYFLILTIYIYISDFSEGSSWWKLGRVILDFVGFSSIYIYIYIYILWECWSSVNPYVVSMD